MGTDASSERTFAKKYGVRKFISYLNHSEELQGLIRGELQTKLSEMGKRLSELVEGEERILQVPLDERWTDDPTATGAAWLQPGFFRSSRFFADFSEAIICVSNKVKFSLHSQKEPLRTSFICLPSELDTFNQYVLLHILPYIERQATQDFASGSSAQRSDAAKTVVRDKLEALREAEFEAEQLEVTES